MGLMLSKTYQALRAASGVSEAQAREAAEEIAAYDRRLSDLESTLKLHTALLGINTALGIAVLVRVFFP